MPDIIFPENPMPAEETAVFEESVQRLEKLIEAMEGGEIPLADLVAKFEEGSKLLRVCRSQLGAAELKIQKLSLEGNKLESFADEPEA